MSEVEANEVDQSQRATEREARAQGWRPQEEFRGDPEAWVSAEDFVRKGREIRAHTKRENDRLARELVEAKAQVNEMKGTLQEFREYHEGMEERAINAAIERLKKERRTATAAGNTEVAAEIEDEIEELKNSPRLADKLGKKEEPKPTNQPQIDPEVQREADSWNRSNQWFATNDPDYEDEIAYVKGLAASLANRADLTAAQKFAELDKRAKAMFPHSLGGEPAPRKQTTTVGSGEGGGGAGRRTAKTGVSGLPDDARQAGERFVRQGLYKDMEAYAKEYWSQPGAKA